ncbi:hypothetical protein [Henriciella marina]|uniref:Lipoprotein n=1 Tax=Henriciella marina TaxID=453851 RepID=A0ABT4LS12_9PROT|nr:hypothetical protein [Henriciella marina]MCZ4297125.1 hypothetical protein [Henriciella marina]
MNARHLALIAGTALVASACVSQEERAFYKDSAYIDESAGFKAFADAVTAHCAPAIEGKQGFADFEVKGATRIRMIDDNKIPVVSSDTLPVWQLAEGLVQMQLDPYDRCEVVAVGLPAETTLEVAINAAKASGFRDAEASADGGRRLVSGQGTAIEFSGPSEAQTPDGRTYTKVAAIVTPGS